MENKTKSSISYGRRNLLKMGLASCALSGVGLGTMFTPRAQASPPTPLEFDRFYYTACSNNCGSACVLKAYVKDDKVIRIETDNSIEDNWDEGLLQVRACPRGRSMRRHMYSPERLKYPMKRVGKRGEGNFERISWDEALDIVATKLRSTIDTHGNEAVLSITASGIQRGPLHRRETFFRLMNLLGGFAAGLSDYSSAQNQTALRNLYGQAGYSGNPITDIAFTRLAVLFASNIIETRMSGGGVMYDLLKAKQKGQTKIIIIDPRYSDSCATIADEWIPIKPGTDAALASALAYVIITENLADTAFLKTHSIGFDSESMMADIPDAPANGSYSDYILGTGYDMIPKTPEWASKITSIPATRIRQLALEIGQTKPCYISQGWGAQRHANGEMSCGSIAALAAITGNMGLRGGNNGDYDSYRGAPYSKFPAGSNPVKIRFPVYLWLKAVEDGKSLTALKDGVVGADSYPTDIKFIWNYGGNMVVNQHSDINNTRRVLGDESKCEMIVTMDTHLTSSAQYSDIILPSCMYTEQPDIISPSWGMNTDWILLTGSVKPYFEARPVFDVCTDLAKRLDVADAFLEGRDREAWINHIYQTATRKYFPEMPESMEDARKMGIQHKAKSRVFPVPFEDFRNDPVAAPLKTPSGKIELFSPAVYEKSKTWQLGTRLGDVIHPVAQYVITWGSSEDYEGKKKHPLQLIGYHFKGRTHSHYGSVDWLQEVAPQTLWINPIDAQNRGMKHNEMVRVFNDKGVVMIRLKVTERIIPGVVAMPQGAWYKPDANGVDMGASMNVLTDYYPTALAKANPQQTNLVEIAKA